MLQIKKKNDAVPIMVYLLILMVVLASKTVFFGIIHMKIMMISALTILFGYNIYITKNMRIHISRNTLRSFAVFTVVLMIVSMFYVKDIMFNFNAYVGAILLFLEVLVIGVLVVNTVKKVDFIKAYVHIMFVISIISLVYFFWSMVDRTAALSSSVVYTSGGARYIALPWYTFGWQATMTNGYIYDYLFGRNAGPFWEPGAFQGFLFLGLFLLLSYKELFERKTILIIVYLLTLITTQSTTAYMALIISLFGFGSDYIDCLFGNTNLSSKSKQMRCCTYIATIIFSFLITYVILISGNIGNKFDSTNGSFLARKEDLKTAMSVLLYNPFAGIGLGKTGSSVANAHTVSATTLLAIAEYFGMPFMIYYAYRFFNGCIALYEPKRLLKKIVLVIDFFMILMSETVYLLPIYAVFLFSTEKWGDDMISAS